MLDKTVFSNERKACFLSVSTFLMVTLAVYLGLHTGFNESLLKSFPSVKGDSIFLTLSTDQSVSNSGLKLLNFFSFCTLPKPMEKPVSYSCRICGEVKYY